MRAVLPLLAVVALIALGNAPTSEAQGSSMTSMDINIDIHFAMMLNALSQPEDSPTNMMTLFSMLPPKVQQMLGPFLKALLKMKIRQMKHDIKKLKQILKNLKNFPNKMAILAALMAIDPDMMGLGMTFKDEMSMKMMMMMMNMPPGPSKDMMMKMLMGMNMPMDPSNPLMMMFLQMQAQMMGLMPPMPPQLQDEFMGMVMKNIPGAQPLLQGMSDSSAFDFSLSLKVQGMFMSTSS